MPPTRILYISHSSEVNGAEMCLLILLKFLNRSRFEPIVLFPGPGPLVNRVEKLGIRSYTLPLDRWIRFPADMVLKDSSASTRVAGIIDIIDHERIDIVQTNATVNHEGAFAAKLKGLPHIWHVHEMLKGHPELTAVLPLGMIFRLMSELSVRIVTEADLVHEQFKGHIDPKKLRTIHTGIEIMRKDASSDAFRASLGFAPQDLIAGTVGTLSLRKGYDTLVDVAAKAAARGSAIKFLWVGPAAPDAVLDWETRIAARGLKGKIRYAGFRSDISRMLTAIDFFILPSVNEAFPVAILEAMAMGKAVIATRCGAVSEMVLEGETGYIAPVGDSDRICEYLMTLASDPALASKMGANGAARVHEHFSASLYAEKFESLYEEILEMESAEPGVKDDTAFRGLMNAVGDIILHCPQRHYATLFMKTADGFRPGSSAPQYLPEIFDEGPIVLDFDLTGFPGIREIRFDPLEGMRVAIDLLAAEAHTAEGWMKLSCCGSNAIQCRGNRFIFGDTDPNFYFTIPGHAGAMDRFRAELRYFSGSAYEEIASGALAALQKPPALATLYVDEGQGFSETVSEKREISKDPGDVLALDFDLNRYKRTMALRFDPVSDSPALIEVKSVYAVHGEDTIPLAINSSNALYREGALFLFATTDPNLVFHLAAANRKFSRFHIEFLFHDADAFANSLVRAITTSFVDPDTATLYVDTGIGYCEQNALRSDIWLGVKDAEATLEFALHSFESISGLRFDPAERAGIVVQIHDIQGFVGQESFSVGIQTSNATFHAEKKYIFMKSDPILGLALPSGCLRLDRLRIRLSYLCSPEHLAGGGAPLPKRGPMPQ